MASPTVRQAVRVAAVNLAVTLGLLAGIELVCRRVERFNIEHRLPEGLRKLPAKAASELRVFAFGGSTVYGAPVPEVAFVAQLRYWLHHLYPDRDIRIYNFGWPAMDSAFVLSQLTYRLEDQPDLLIVITGHNEFLHWNPGVDPRIARVQGALALHFATFRLMQRGLLRFTHFQHGSVAPSEVGRWDRDSANFGSRIATFNKYMDLIVERASRRGVKLIVGTLPSNLSDWPPVYKKLQGRDLRYADTVSLIKELLRAGKYQEAAGAVTAGFSLYPEDAMLFFLRGQIQSAMGSYADAHESFVKARDMDPVPWRATSQVNSIIRKAASGVASVYLLDLEKVFEKHSKNSLVSFDLIADNVHGTPLGESVTAQAIIQKMTEIGFLPRSRPSQDSCCPVDPFLADAGYLAPKSPLHLRVLLSNALYCMEIPFLDYEASRMYLLMAMQVDPDSWVVWANLATLSYFAGDAAVGAKELERATELHHAPLDLNNRAAIPYLKSALQSFAGRASDGVPPR